MQLVHRFAQVGHILHLIQFQDVKPERRRHQAVAEAVARAGVEREHVV